MCGLVVAWDRGARTRPDVLREGVIRMRETLVHRGPDDAGAWIDPAAGVGLGHRRLSIVDLSAAGHQPMASPGGRFHVVFNGEIYNAPELRRQIREVAWRGHSDTEVLCAALERWGPEAAAARLVGMFAIAAWDVDERVLWLIRDRTGQKPLYWTRADGWVLAGSELRALRVHPACPTTLDRQALAGLLARRAIPQPRSVLEGVAQVAPGTTLRIDRTGAARTRAYVDLLAPARKDPIPRSPEAAADAVEGALRRAVRRRLMADVPLGTLLSGGIDSSLVTALLAAESSRPRTFTIAVEGEGFDESEHAARIARHLGTDHHTLPLRGADLERLVPRLATLQDEPLADASLAPTALVSALTRAHVTVALAGDGADELFGGYTRYGRALRVWGLARRVPGGLRRGVHPMARALRRAAVTGAGAPRLDDALRRLDRITRPDLDAVWAGTLDTGPQVHAFLQGARPWRPPGLPLATGAPVHLHEDVVAQVDRASMASSLELRAPFLDPEVLSLALTLPVEHTWAGGPGKAVLRRILARHLPRPLWDRPKRGFGVPLAAWLRGPLRDWAEALLAPRALAEDDLWSPAPIRRAWAAHLAGIDRSVPLWIVLQVQAWRRVDPAEPVHLGGVP